MTLTRYVIMKPNGKLYTRYNSDVEMVFKDIAAAEKVAVSWGKVKKVEIKIEDS